MDAALQVEAAQRVWEADRTRALDYLGRAVELVPGAPDLLTLEQDASRGVRPGIAALDLVTWSPVAAAPDAASGTLDQAD
jgi:hypothetical protein